MSVLEFLFQRLKRVEHIDKIILITGTEKENSKLIEEAKRLRIEYFCGNQENILDRMYNATKKFNPDNIIRITGDCPLIDPNLINKGFEEFSKKQVDVLSNARVRTFPDGFDFEIIKADSIKKAWKDTYEKFEDKNKFYSSFISPTKYLLENEQFSNIDFTNEINLSKIRLTLDYKEDFDVISKISEHLYSKKIDFGLSEIVDYLEKNPEILEVNKKFIKLDYGIKVNKNHV